MQNFQCKQSTSWPIRHLYIFHNAPYLSPPRPQILHNLCFPFGLLGITAVPREIESNAGVKFWGANKVHDGLRLSHNLLGNFSVTFDFFSILKLFFTFSRHFLAFERKFSLIQLV